MKKISIVFGTRPELIKMSPLINVLKKSEEVKVDVCFTGQHEEMVDPLLRFLKVHVDHSLKIMKKRQPLAELNGRAIEAMNLYFEDVKPDFVYVQGDTTTAMSAAVAAFYRKIPVGHIEAGLRTGNMLSPFPEEYNRRVISLIAELHFAPTELSRENLLKELILPNKVFVTGNTVIDCLRNTLDSFKSNGYKPVALVQRLVGKKIILITSHRRENFGKSFENICGAIREIATKYPDFELVYPVHLNPNVQEPVFRLLKGISNVHLLPPLNYPDFIFLMQHSYCILSDSGGIQEESALLNIPLLVMRQNTERSEGMQAGTSILVGAKKEKIIREIDILIKDKKKYNEMASAPNPFGDGNATKMIIDKTLEYLR